MHMKMYDNMQILANEAVYYDLYQLDKIMIF